MSSRNDKSRICIGVITGAKGIKGELRIKPLTVKPQDVAAYGPVETEDGSRQLVLSKVTISGKGKGIVARAEGITTRNQAEALKGIRLYVAKATLPPIDQDEYYQADLIGLKVTKQDGTEIGAVVALQDFGAGDLLEIRLYGRNATVLLPFTVECVPHVDVPGGIVSVDPPEGLFDVPDGSAAMAQDVDLDKE